MVGSFDKDPDGGLSFKDVVLNSLAEGRVYDAFKSRFSAPENKRLVVFPAFRRVKEEGGILGELLESNDGKALIGGELVHVQRFKLEVEVLWFEQ